MNSKAAASASLRWGRSPLRQRCGALVRPLNLHCPIRRALDAYGHFRGTDLALPGERTDLAERLQAAACGRYERIHERPAAWP
ncbi:MAG: hypothetical protein AB1609_19650 [Bacillota bacterium]